MYLKIINKNLLIIIYLLLLTKKSDLNVIRKVQSIFISVKLRFMIC